MVEHNLAKVRVASSSLVCRSIEMSRNIVPAFFSLNAQMAELVDALVSGASVERRAGSSPVLGTDLPFGKEIFQNSCKATMRRW